MSRNLANPSCVLYAARNLVIEDRPVPEITDPHYVKIAVKKTGICGSDVHYYQNGRNGLKVVKSPMVLGHESSGVIAEIGSEVTSVKVGDRVAIEPGIPSRYSDAYKSGNYNLCPCMVFAASPPNNGTLARYFMVPDDFVVKLPDHVSLEEGAIVEPLSVAVHSCRLANVTFGDRCVIYGAGPVGLLIAATAKAYGATEIMVVDIFDDKLELAKQLGATHTYNSSEDRGASEDDNRTFQLAAFGGNVPNIVFDATGVEACITAGINLIKVGGTFMQVGVGKVKIEFPMAAVGNKELTVKGVYRYSHDDYRLAVKLVGEGKVDVKKLVTHRFTFDHAVEAYEVVSQGRAVKCIIDGPEDAE
ncbi:hypothetical protein BABINDRAFT_170826 [Babjeviella inositovora NRRL Y-12698]|uniref:Enoyl reductase (ER) domain-containing protein n=1 Tax=Babjeviella inositovora NRRL Y-12698 TaxID=984486 RepID=A0A1E3QU61_9ASCO|nr:uncharacterized protein BABINDRAFT_170826 [Babjeviella inositovora NRRL Y-12698]ODQ81221.1 hypothetical protein BABINDRAFT_170826 [Babjeviella inositovora NRRL Y-12698]